VDDLLSEKEQIEKMRTWWADYGNYVIGGVVLGALALFGIDYYQDAKRDAAYQASSLYDDLTDLVVDGELDEAEAIAGRLEGEFGESNYAAQARLAMARLYMDQNRDEDAADALRGLLAMDIGEEFKHVARIRLAKVLLYQDKAEEAADLVSGVDEGAFASRYAEVLGDAYAALNRPEDARSAYQRALFETGNAATVDQNFVQLKLLDLPLEGAPAGDAVDAVDDASEAADDAAADVEPAGEDPTPEPEAAAAETDEVAE
jgi:predicted negative regulator of RcsB-dependent stress response